MSSRERKSQSHRDVRQDRIKIKSHRKKKSKGNPSLFLRKGLQLYEFVVIAMERKKLVMGSRFANSTLFEEVSVDIISICADMSHIPPGNVHAVSILDG